MGETIAGLLAGRAADTNPGIVTETSVWTWSEVVSECSSRAAVFEELGVAGKHVGVLLENVPEYVFLLGGAALTGTTVVGINSTRRGRELARDIEHTDCAIVLTDRTLSAQLDDLTLDVDIVCVDEAAWLDRLASHENAPPPGAALEPETLFMLIFTSGSTSAPKAVKMSQGRMARSATSASVAFTPDDVLYCSMPLFHGNALSACLFAGVASGASVVLRSKFSASSFLPDVRRYGCTYFNYVGRALSYILAQPPTSEDLDNKLKFCLGTEASPRDRAEFRHRFGCAVFEGYGSSEGAVVIQAFPGMPKEALGRPNEGMDVAVVDPETMLECPRAMFNEDHLLLNPTETIGEIVGRNVLSSFEGYYDNEEADAERSRNGWYWTGDLGYVDEEGTFYFAGRNSDWLRVDQENFAAGSVESILRRFPGVAAVVVYPVPDPRTGDQVMAALELDAGVEFSPPDFVSFLDHQPDLGTKWAPRFVRIADGIPATASGKIDRKPLRNQVWRTTDPVWWRPDRAAPYRLLDVGDVVALEREFAEAGRRALLT